MPTSMEAFATVEAGQETKFPGAPLLGSAKPEQARLINPGELVPAPIPAVTITPGILFH